MTTLSRSEVALVVPEVALDPEALGRLYLDLELWWDPGYRVVLKEGDGLGWPKNLLPFFP